MIDLKQLDVWFVTGSQHSLRTGNAEAGRGPTHRKSSGRWTAAAGIPVRVVCKPVVKTPEAAAALCQEANSAKNCIGLFTWMHTFSPAKMWIAGLNALRKPFAASAHPV